MYPFYLFDFYPNKAMRHVSLLPNAIHPKFTSPPLTDTFPFSLLVTLPSDPSLRSKTEPYQPRLTSLLRKANLPHPPFFVSLSRPLCTAVSVSFSSCSDGRLYKTSIYTLSFIPHTAKSHSLSHLLKLPYAYPSSSDVHI